jgi:class 3 adenylate cyclase
MVKKLPTTISFKPEASHPTQALVLLFDLGGFSKFFSQPDAHLYVPKFLNRIFNCVSLIINGGQRFWLQDDSMRKPFLLPVHQKFLGDGALYIWTFQKGMKEFDEKSQDIILFINELWNLKNTFSNVLEHCKDEVPVVDLPNRIRFGLAAGSVYKLTYENSTQTEYIGYPINLASRLQGYCRDLGFIASARINMKEKTLSKHGYLKVIAKNLKGFPKEIVIVDEKEYEKLDPKIREELFEPLGSA